MKFGILFSEYRERERLLAQLYIFFLALN